MAEGQIDLIRLEGEGNSVILRISGTMRPQNYRVTDDLKLEGPVGSEVLVGDFVVNTGFVSGSLWTAVSLADLWEWRDVLDGLDAGHDIAWREDGRAPELFIEREPDEARASVTIRDRSRTLSTVTATVTMYDSWFDDAYERLDLVLKTWPLATS